MFKGNQRTTKKKMNATHGKRRRALRRGVRPSAAIETTARVVRALAQSALEIKKLPSGRSTSCRLTIMFCAACGLA